MLCSHDASIEQATDGCANMTVELSSIVDLFLMSFPIMQAMIPIRSYPRELAVEWVFVIQCLAFSCIVRLCGSSLKRELKLKQNI